jgi:hypothetical protein
MTSVTVASPSSLPMSSRSTQQSSFSSGRRHAEGIDNGYFSLSTYGCDVMMMTRLMLPLERRDGENAAQRQHVGSRERAAEEPTN